MIYPLSWLSEYVTLPKDPDELAVKLTMAGHMLDKLTKKDGDIIMDLELRGNRPDLLGVYGLAREISALYDKPLKNLQTLPLNKLRSSDDLVVVKSPELVERFFAINLAVKVKPSPDWLKKRLSFFGVPSINNVVDITNLVMLETGEPMHAFDRNRLAGKHLILRRAKKDEVMTTLLGTPVNLTLDDLVLSDDKIAQGLTMIGGQNSGTTNETTEIILEAAVYKYANVRRTGRRLGIRTEAGTRHEKILDPNSVEIALERALYLLTEFAEAKPLGLKTDFYPEKVGPTKISLSKTKISQLTGVEVPYPDIEKILTSLGAKIEKTSPTSWLVNAPSFRTDLKDQADLVEEVIRVYGYEKVPVETMPATISSQSSLTNHSFKETLRDVLVSLGLNEVITLSIRDNNEPGLFEVGGQYPKVIKLVNPPDPDVATLRPSLIPGLVVSAKKADSFKQQNLSFFEIGKVFFQTKSGQFCEEDRLAIIKKISGPTTQLSYAKAAGIIRSVFGLTGGVESLTRVSDIPAFDPNTVAEISLNKKAVGFIGLLNPEIKQKLKLSSDFLIAELSVDTLFNSKATPETDYFLYPSFPSLYEDLTIEVTNDSDLGGYLREIAGVSPLIKDVRLTGIYENSRTIRITYQDPSSSVSGDVVKPIREQIEKLGKTKYKFSIK